MDKNDKKNAPRETELVTTSQLDALADQLQRWVDEVRLASSIANTVPTKGLATYSWASAEAGMKRLKSFMSALEDSRLAAQMGKPFEAGQLKPRTTAKKQAKADKAKVDAYAKKQLDRKPKKET